MIKPREKSKIIKTLGKHYSNSIIKELNFQNLLNSDGKEFSSESIRQIVGGFTENEPVEIAILKFVAKDIIRKKNTTTYRRKILTKK